MAKKMGFPAVPDTRDDPDVDLIPKGALPKCRAMPTSAATVPVMTIAPSSRRN
ncbi:MAG: hypothetical protein VB860_00460 [Dehalococcoidia bacterium]